MLYYILVYFTVNANYFLLIEFLFKFYNDIV